MNDNNNLTEHEVNELFFKVRPKLINYAKKFSIEYYEDLVNTTYLKVLNNNEKFQRGSNFNGWCFTILRNEWLGLVRKLNREVQDTDNKFTMHIGVDGFQEENLEIEQLQSIVRMLSKKDRDVLMHIGVLGLTYEEASEKIGLPVGTIKSSYSRLKEAIKETLQPTMTTYEKPISKEELEILHLHDMGNSISEIAKTMGLKRSEIMKVIG